MNQGGKVHSGESPAPEKRRVAYAHSLPNRPVAEWETMAQHEEAVARLCAQFLSRIHPDLAPWGDLLGRWHDLGKYSDEFQDYLERSCDPDASSENKGKRVNHSSAGAQHAMASLPKPFGDIFAYLIAGHHAGLADRVSASGQKRSGLDERLKEKIPNWSNAPAEILTAEEFKIPWERFDQQSPSNCGFQLSLLCRMAFSALCDADFLATEHFMSPEKAGHRALKPDVSICDLSNSLEQYLKRFDPADGTASAVNARRAEILNQCQRAAELPPGLYSLTVPTGGGKTLSSLSFALRHANKHELDRVIYAIPFTSIIDQTGTRFREVFESLGDEVVLEHHSNLDPDAASRIGRLASENWDARLVVTTNVQFFESFFANRTSRCRKLHRVAKSVIIFDEIQTLPVEYLQPCLMLIRSLVNVFGCTVVLCTATQPTFAFRDDFKIGLSNIREIIADPIDLYKNMKRITVHTLPAMADEDLATRLSLENQTLCIVNTRAHASELFRLIQTNSPSGTAFHLSTNMVGVHRSKTLKQIFRRLKNDRPCRVVSTQLIEAGVDIDFPVVYRALTGLDSIAQAAGRCNREGKQPTGDVFVFEPQGRRLFGYLNSIAQTASEVIPLYADVLSLEAIEHYFRLHYWNQADRWDAHEIVGKLSDLKSLTFQFRSAAEAFRFIDDNTRTVFVPWGDKGERIEKKIRTRKFGEDPVFRRSVLRKLQRYTVSVFPNVFNSLAGNEIELIDEELGILINMDMYRDEIGFDLKRTGCIEPETAIC